MLNKTIALTAAAGLVVGLGTGIAVAPPKTADSCKDALTKAETVIQDAQKALTVISGGVGFDVSAMDAATAQLNSLAPQIKDDRAAYDDAAAKCRG